MKLLPRDTRQRNRLRTGQTARIMTGAMMPEGADAVVMQEVTQQEGNKVKIFEGVDASLRTSVLQVRALRQETW